MRSKSSARSFLTTAAFALGIVLSSREGRAQTWTTIAPGVETAEYMRASTKVYASKIDLCAPGVRMRATAPGEGPSTVSTFGAKVGAALAVNGDWWSNDGEPHLPDTYPRGLAAGDGKHFPGTVDRPSYGVVAFGPSIVLHSVMEEDLGGLHFWMQDVVSGQPTLIWDGVARNNPAAHCGTKRARTAVGFDSAKTKMIIAVVQEVSGSVGMTCNEMASLMLSLGCHTALNQDGGGSSTFWTKNGGVRNAPTDGSQRSLVNHWGVIATGEGPPRSCVARDVAPPGQGTRRHVKDPTVMASWKLRMEDVNFMGDDVFQKYAEGQELVNAPRFLQHSDRSLWLVDQGTKRHVKTFYAIATWRIDIGEVTKNADAELASLPEGPPVRELPHLVLGPQLGVWMIDSVVPPQPGSGSSGPPNVGPNAPGSGAPDDPSPPPRGQSEESTAGCNVIDSRGETWLGAAIAAAVVALGRRARRRPR